MPSLNEIKMSRNLLLIILVAYFHFNDFNQQVAASIIRNSTFLEFFFINDDFKIASALKFYDTRYFYFRHGERTSGWPPEFKLQCDIFKSENSLCFDIKIDLVVCENLNYHTETLPQFQCDFKIHDPKIIVEYKITCRHPSIPDYKEYYEENSCYLKYNLNKEKNFTTYIIIGCVISALAAIIAIGIFICVRKAGGCSACLAECSDSGGTSSSSGFGSTSYR